MSVIVRLHMSEQVMDVFLTIFGMGYRCWSTLYTKSEVRKEVYIILIEAMTENGLTEYKAMPSQLSYHKWQLTFPMSGNHRW